MANTRITIATGAIDGANVKFYAPVAYVPGSTAYILNGRVHNLLLSRGVDNDYGYLETNPDTGEITVDVPPAVDDVVQIFFTDRAPAPTPILTHLTGSLHPVAGPEGSTGNRALIGTLRKPDVVTVTGVIAGTKRLAGVLSKPATGQLTGVVQANRLIGRLREKC